MSAAKTNEILLSMMRENHGGGWPGATPMGVVNQRIDLEAEPAADIVHYGSGDWGVRVSTFHWLSHHLTYDARLDTIFQKWDTLHATRGGQYAMKDFFAWYSKMRHSSYDMEFDGVHYTYNDGENNISQDFQYAFITLELGTWVLLQTHNGVDARDGLSDIRVFKLENGSYATDELLLYNDVGVFCSAGHNWNGDKYALRAADRKTSEKLRELPRRALHEDDGVERRYGELWMDTNGVLYCPLCEERNPLYAECNIG